MEGAAISSAVAMAAAGMDFIIFDVSEAGFRVNLEDMAASWDRLAAEREKYLTTHPRGHARFDVGEC